MRQRKLWIVGLALFAGFCVTGAGMAAPGSRSSQKASVASPARAAGGFVGQLRQEVSLTAEQEETVRGLLAEQRKAYGRVREQTDQKIRDILNPEQQVKFDAMRSRRTASARQVGSSSKAR